MKQVTDQMGRILEVPESAQRIVSTVPSQTELLFDLGLGPRIVGRTKFCIHPADQVKGVPIVGGTKNLHLDKIRDLKPDLIIGNKEENEEGQVLDLAKDFPVWMSDIHTWEDGIDMIRGVSIVLGVEASGLDLIRRLDEAKNNYRIPDQIKSARVLYLIWQDPMMGVGKNTFIDSMLSLMGVQNALSTYERYPELSEQEVIETTPTHIFLSSEPFPFKEKHVDHYQRIFPNIVIRIVDGELFSWYGSRMLKSMEYFKELSQKL